MTEAELYALVSECNPAMCWKELAALALILQDLECDAVLEIGVHRGGSLLFWRRLFDPGLLIGVDNDVVALQAADLCAASIVAPCLSQDPVTFEVVYALLAGKLLDLLVIDGGHRLDEVKADFEMYSPLVRRGGAVVFHDICAPVTDECQVPTYWRQVRESHRLQLLKGSMAHLYEVYLPDAPGSTGLGAVFL